MRLGWRTRFVVQDSKFVNDRRDCLKVFLTCIICSLGAFSQTLNVSSQPGAPDVGLQITNAIAALGGNGTVVASSKTNQNFATCPAWGNNKLTLELYPVQYSWAVNCSVPINVTLKLWNGAVLAPASGINLTINGNVDARPQQKIVNISNGNVIFQNVPVVWWDWYGAGNLINSRDAIQAGFNAMAMAGDTAGHKPPFYCVPGSNYILNTKPVHIATSIVFGGPGAGSESCGFRENWGFGPSLVIGPGPGQAYCGNGASTCPQSAPLVAGLTSSGGNAIRFDGVHPYWFNWSLDTKEFLAVNGLTQLTLEAFVNTQSATTGAILGSSGSFSQSSRVTQAFQLYMVGASLYCKLTTSAGVTTVNGGRLAPGTTYHVACSWDGTTARLFIGGVKVASAKVSGTLVQGVTVGTKTIAAEDVTIGPALQFWPDAGPFTQSCKCTIDSPRISNIARYTSDSGFTPPTAKFTADTNTLGLMNFGNCFDVFCDFQSKDTSGFLFFRNGTFGSAINNVKVHDMFVGTGTGFGGGVYWYQTNRWQQDNVHFVLNAPAVDYFWNNAFIGSINSVYIDNGGTGTGPLGHGMIGLGLIGAVGVVRVRDLNITGGQFGVVSNGGSGLFDGLLCSPNTETEFCFFGKSSGGSETFQFNQIACDAEISSPNAYQACVYLANIRAQFIGGEPEGSTQSAIFIDGGDTYSLIGTRFLNTGASGYRGSAIHIVTPPSQPVHLFNATQAAPFSGGWCDVAAACVAF
jgi:hypothetical protein